MPLLANLQGAVLEIRHPHHNLANISFKGIMIGDLGVHVGVYKKRHLEHISNTLYKWLIFTSNPVTKLVLDYPSLWQNCYYFVTH